MSSQNPLVSVNLLTYNGEKYIGPCLDSVFAQSYPNIDVLIMDNASSDGTIKKIEKHLDQNHISVNPRSYPRQSASMSLKAWQTRDTNRQITLIASEDNLGFAKGHNQLIKESGGEIVLCLNQDVVLDENFVKNAVDVFQNNSEIGVVQGKLLRLVSGKRSDIIDTTGLLVLKNRRIINRGQRQKDICQFNGEEEIFGADGAAPMYRREALEDVRLPLSRCHSESRLGGAKNDKKETHQNLYEYFDEDFFCYKEDVDLAWRLRLYGWKTFYQPKSVAWHTRGSGDSAAFNPFAIIKERKKLSRISKFYSFKNQRLMQIKNELPLFFIKHFPFIIVKELAAWAYVLIFENYTLRAVKSLIKEIPGAFRKRKVIMKNRRVTLKGLAEWFL